jgi:hypothetical protein
LAQTTSALLGHLKKQGFEERLEDSQRLETEGLNEFLSSSPLPHSVKGLDETAQIVYLRQAINMATMEPADPPGHVYVSARLRRSMKKTMASTCSALAEGFPSRWRVRICQADQASAWLFNWVPF